MAYNNKNKGQNKGENKKPESQSTFLTKEYRQIMSASPRFRNQPMGLALFGCHYFRLLGGAPEPHSKRKDNREALFRITMFI
ncbi:MAG: hypothetical protein IKS11_08140 [Lachnospiraceae bacterium]|nr:hypothetical protein [Lachnospiraceae bacterium]